MCKGWEQPKIKKHRINLDEHKLYDVYLKMHHWIVIFALIAVILSFSVAVDLGGCRFRLDYWCLYKIYALELIITKLFDISKIDFPNNKLNDQSNVKILLEVVNLDPLDHENIFADNYRFVLSWLLQLKMGLSACILQFLHHCAQIRSVEGTYKFRVWAQSSYDRPDPYSSGYFPSKIRNFLTYKRKGKMVLL